MNLAIFLPALLGGLGLVFVGLFALMRWLVAKELAALALEGIELDSGPAWVTVRMRGYRAPGINGVAVIRKGRGRLVLSKQQLAFVPRSRRIAYADFGRFTAWEEAGALRVGTDDPPGATGHIDFRITVGDAAAWVAMLRERGMRAA
jgi:hypothetical protein